MKYNLTKYNLLCEGIMLIKDHELFYEWKELVKKSNDPYSNSILLATCIGLRKLEEETTYEEIESLFHDLNLTLYMKDTVIENLAHFTPKGIMLQKYWENNKIKKSSKLSLTMK